MAKYYNYKDQYGNSGRNVKVGIINNYLIYANKEIEYASTQEEKDKYNNEIQEDLLYLNPENKENDSEETSSIKDKIIRILKIVGVIVVVYIVISIVSWHLSLLLTVRFK